MAESHFALARGGQLFAYADQGTCDRFDKGAGQSILRLPDNPLAPVPPAHGTGRLSPSLVADYIKSVTDRVRKAQANYGVNDAWLALHETYGENKDRLSRAENYLKDAVDDIKRQPRIGAETHKALVSHFRNADLRAAFFCPALVLPYPGDKPLSMAPRRRPTAADLYLPLGGKRQRGEYSGEDDHVEFPEKFSYCSTVPSHDCPIAIHVKGKRHSFQSWHIFTHANSWKTQAFIKK